MSSCNLCPRKCFVDRSTKLGFCGQAKQIKIARAAPHKWEEPCISGKNGSGTVFFCGCTLGCVYCQNAAISRGREENGVTVTPSRFAEIFISLEEKGVHNINLVTPTMFSPQIAEAVDIARAKGLTLPIVYNTSGYELPSALDIMGDRIDVYMPDFKYISADLSAKYSSADDYSMHARTSLSHMVKKIGESVFDNDGMMRRGVIVRHLLLPGMLKESMRVLDYLFSEYGNCIYYSIMSQYTPTAFLDKNKYPELARRVTTYEYNKLVDYALSLGITNGFIQDGGAARESFIPFFGADEVL